MRWMLRCLASLGMAGALAGAATAQTLTYCSEGNPEGFDPALHVTATTFDASSRVIYDRLVEFAHGTTNVVPGLAERWEVSVDGLEYTFHLRSDVNFHATDDFQPTRELNADDVIFTFKRQMDEDDPFFDYGGGVWPFFEGLSMARLIASIEKVDDRTVKFVLTQPEAPFIANLAMDFASIVSKEYAGGLAAADRRNLDLRPVGTGPFRFLGHEADGAVRYTANAQYWNGAPAIDDLVFAVTPSDSLRVRKLRDGACQLIAPPSPADVAALADDPSVVLRQSEGLGVAYLAFNTTQPPFDDPNVRRALTMAIDKQAIVDAVYGGAARVAETPIPPSVWSYDATITGPGHDPDAAAAALAEAGVEDLTMNLWVPTVDRPYNPDPRRMAELIQADFAAIGVEAEIVALDLGDFIRRSAAIDRDAAVLFGWTGDNGDPDNFLGALLGCDGIGISNRAQWCDVDFNDAVLLARTVSDRDERARLYHEAQRIFADQTPWAVIAHTLVTVPMRTTVDGYLADPFGRHDFASLRIVEPPPAAPDVTGSATGPTTAPAEPAPDNAARAESAAPEPAAAIEPAATPASDGLLEPIAGQ